jgi:hypothetical protein
MADRYIPPAWRNRDSPVSIGSSRAWPGQPDNRESSTHAGRSQVRGRGAMRAPESSGPSRWQTAQQAGESSCSGDIWSSLPASNGRPSPSWDEPNLRKPDPSSSSYRPTPTYLSDVDPTTRTSIQTRQPPSTLLPSRQSPGDARSWSSKPPSTPSRPLPTSQSTSLSSPSTDLQPISSSHRAFKKLDEMEMLGTLSRSGGNGDGEGDELLERETQEKFLRWIEDKVRSPFLFARSRYHEQLNSGWRLGS